ncbi:MAG: SH3 domain-containing protein, partial [Acidobacteriia bacterium]|nr:SH3 domain-containing protein [Terriglobia bacterium]
VRVNTKVTAWYVDAVPGRSGYKLLTSNGRLETDLLDQLAEQLISMPGNVEARAPKTATLPRAGGPRTAEPTISAPMPNRQETGAPFSSSVNWGLSAQELAGSKATQQKLPDQEAGGLQAEAASLEEVLRNQTHPKNIVAVKKSGTAVVAAPSLTAKPLFLASMHDEFEMLDFNRDWVHVRISGISRGWIWRDSLEMPEGIPDNPQANMTPPPAGDLFQVSREETAPFPGDWEPLRGKTVKIVSVQKTRETSKDSGPEAKLEFAKFLLDRNYADVARKSKDLSGIVLIFDSADGGMIAAPFSALQRWKAGMLSDSALWHQCFFDPPETFSVSGSSSGR